MHISQKEYEAFVQSLAPEMQAEQYRYLHYKYDVTMARFIIHKLRLKPVDLGVKLWAEEMHINQPAGQCQGSILSSVSDTKALRPEIDYRIPGIVATHIWGTQKVRVHPLLIDGHHRLRKAFVENKEIIKVYFLSKQVTPLICTKL